MNAFERVRRRGSALALPFVLTASGWRYGTRQIRTWMARTIYGIDIGPGSYWGASIRFVSPLAMKFGNKVTVRERVRFWCETDTGRLDVKDGVEIGSGALIDFSGNLRIGEYALISEDAIVYTHDHGRDPHSQPRLTELHIGDHAWIGARAIVLPSVNRIGRNAVIGAGAVVTTDVPDGATFVGASGRLLPTDETVISSQS